MFFKLEIDWLKLPYLFAFSPIEINWWTNRLLFVEFQRYQGKPKEPRALWNILKSAAALLSKCRR
ncbi:hypothetical protein ACTXT7_013923, partial [Hymenolepis weldensis]